MQYHFIISFLLAHSDFRISNIANLNRILLEEGCVARALLFVSRDGVGLLFARTGVEGKYSTRLKRESSMFLILRIKQLRMFKEIWFAKRKTATGDPTHILFFFQSKDAADTEDGGKERWYQTQANFGVKGCDSWALWSSPSSSSSCSVPEVIISLVVDDFLSGGRGATLPRRRNFK